MKKIIYAAVGLALSAMSASATTVYYDQFVTGTDIGTNSIATLTATQNGNDVDFTLKNTISGQLSTSFIAAISFTYDGTLPNPLVVTELAGSEAGIEGIGSQGLSGGGNLYSFTFGVQIDNSNGGNPNNPPPDRLEVGETAMFRLDGVLLSDFNFGTYFTSVHAQGLNGGGSTKYAACQGEDCDGGGVGGDVPLPAAAWMLLTALGGLGAMRKFRKA